MTMKRIRMKKLRELLRLKFDAKLQHRQIAAALAISPGTTSYYARAAQSAGITWPIPEGMDDDELVRRIEPHAKQLRVRAPRYIIPNWQNVHEMLGQKFMTLQLLWDDYKALHQDKAYSYCQYTRLYKNWCKSNKLSMRMVHIPGDKAFIDYAGATIPIYCRQSKTVVYNAQLFVMVLGASDYTFVYASKSQQLPDWVHAHTKAFEYFGGVPRILVPDNLKSGVTNSCQFEPEANPTYADMAEHYNTAIIPARPYTPKDKAKAEGSVLIVERWMVTRLLKQRFYSLNALNKAIAELLTALNHKPFQKRQGSRHSQFVEHEKAALRPLPPQPYEYTQLKQLTVPPDYHLRFDGHYYSVPYQRIGDTVLCRITQNTLEIFYKNQRIASHLRSDNKDAKTTLTEHMPKAHLNHSAWTPQVFLDWADTVGPGAVNAASTIIQQKKHPEQCHKIYYGFRRLAKRFTKQRLNNACRRAIALGCLSYDSLLSILERGLDQQPHITEVVGEPTPQHNNVRGADYYRSSH